MCLSPSCPRQRFPCDSETTQDNVLFIEEMWGTPNTCVTSDVCEGYASCFIAYWNNSHKGWILCACVHVYSVVSLEAQEKNVCLLLHIPFLPEICPWSCEEVCSHLVPTEVFRSWICVWCWDQMPEHMLFISIYVCCCSSMTWLSRNTVQHEQWKAALHAEEEDLDVQY